MTDNKINLKSFQILPDRKAGIESTIIEKIGNSIVRQLFQTRAFDSSTHGAIEFRKLGISSITNKEWFVEMPDDHIWNWQELPEMYIRSIEEGEIKLVTDRLLVSIKSENIFSNIVEDKNPESALNFGSLLDKALAKLSDADLIITNIYDHHKFFYLGRDNYKHGNTKNRAYVSGTYKGIDILDSRVVPRGKTIVLNKKKIGEFIIKKDISATLSEIPDEDRPKLKENLKLSDEDLNNDIRLLIEEIIQFIVTKPENAILVETEKEEIVKNEKSD